jgi:hypothetical protein
MIYSISNSTGGRFGNNLFQYIASKLVQHILFITDERKLEYIFNKEKKPTDFIITDDIYIDYINNPNKLVEDSENKHIYLDGYFQFDEHIRKYKDFISSILTVTNDEKINSNNTVSQLMQTVDVVKIGMNESILQSTLFVHIRLDDFMFEKICMKVECYIKIIDTILKENTNLKKVIIIMDNVKYKFEVDYLQQLARYFENQKIPFEIQHFPNLLVDFGKMYHAPYFLSSNSTFSYLAGLLGNHTKSWCPVNTVYTHQKINKFDDNCTSFNIEYIN